MGIIVITSKRLEGGPPLHLGGASPVRRDESLHRPI
ncbi:hypothetical protein OCC_14245 [Thermococcus litoralis DSM 5473]|uniref:NERD domain-containing protein n=1 Tax=Thermococcus litoralis (strain ATCC 51850 / DSM 5473 / JCM 8560 / NS-C) TaxID=523849 RepID=S5ZB92_THELN|nr:hypothetical protein OCC_14245 [Thermococcus litoralis DSM 5473]